MIFSDTEYSEDRLLMQYQKDRADGKCYVKYYKYGFVDYMFDGCECKDCSMLDKAQDIVEGKKATVSAKTALLNNVFTEKDADKYVDIFVCLGIFTTNELAGIYEIGALKFL